MNTKFETPNITPPPLPVLAAEADPTLVLWLFDIHNYIQALHRDMQKLITAQGGNP